MATTNGTGDRNQVGRPTLGAVREPLRHNLSDQLYVAGQMLLDMSRKVERQEVGDYQGQGEVVGSALLKIVLLHGQLGALDEAEGGKMHGRTTPTFPDADPEVTDQVQRFRERRDLERTQRRQRPPEFDAPPDFSADPEPPSDYP
jgi:hypothetical protein